MKATPLTTHQISMLEAMLSNSTELLAQVVTTVRAREREAAHREMTCGHGHTHPAALWGCPDRAHSPIGELAAWPHSNGAEYVAEEKP